jgi:primase-polymerase (primpol)-like protein
MRVPTDVRRPLERPPRPSEPLWENFPAELTVRKQWVCWRYIRKGDKWTKVPYQPDGTLASPTDPSTWSAFEDVQTSYDTSQRVPFDGVGFALSPNGGFAGFDFDHCIDPGTRTITDAKVKEYVLQLGSYTEISPSGTGLRIFVRGKLPPGRRRKGPVECYEDRRYLTITGNHHPGTPTTIKERHKAVEAVHARIFAQRNARPSTRVLPVEQSRKRNSGDEGLLEKARRARNGKRFAALYDKGDWQAEEFPSQSEADFQLCAALAFWLGHDPSRIDAAFRRSALMRPKWNRDDYRKQTINKAIAIAGVYKPSRDDGLAPAKSWEVPEEVREVEKAANAARWIGRGKATERAVLFAHIAIPKSCCLNPYGASVREIAERSKKQQLITVVRAHRRLEVAGWLEVVERHKGERPTVWRLRVPKEGGGSKVTQSSPPTVYEECVKLDPPLPSMSHAEVFRYGRGLGEAARPIFSAVFHCGPITAARIAKKLGYSDKRSVKVHLKRMEKLGLVARFGIGDRSRAVFWCLGPKNEFDLADERRLSGETQRQHHRHAEEREGWRIGRKLQNPKTATFMSDGSAVDATTGEILIDRMGYRVGTTPESEAPSGYVAVTPDESGADAMQRFLKKLGGRVTQDGDVRRIEPPELVKPVSVNSAKATRS